MSTECQNHIKVKSSVSLILEHGVNQ